MQTVGLGENAPRDDAVGKVMSARGRLGFVDGLRGVAVLLVLFRHYYLGVFDYGLPRWSDAFGLGYLGVHLFLLLSGFCVSWAYLRPKPDPYSNGQFFFRRATRILPAYYVALALSLALHGRDFSTPELVKQIVTHLTMTHNFFPSTVLALNGPFWSLALECQLYLFFPFLFRAITRRGVVLMLAGALAVELGYRIWALRFGTDYTDLTFVVPWGVLGRLFEFALGMVAAQWVAHDAVTSFPRIVQRILPVAMLPAFAAALVSKRLLGVTHPLTDLLWSAGFFALIVAGSRTPGVLHHVLSWKPLERLGEISYSVYLLHEVVLGPLTGAVRHMTADRIHPLVLMPFTVLAAILLSSLFYSAFERPSIAFFRGRALARAVLK